ncbi:MAG: TIGR00269 family protein [Candidatus Woesearchaeota archaeon]
MQCCVCNNNAIITKPEPRCSDHFKEYFEATVKDTIKRFSLISPGEKIVVAASGGKDSMTLLYLLHSFGYHVHALAVDEGIKGYRDETLEHLRAFCTPRSIPLKIVSFKETTGKTLDEMKPEHPCSTCGVLRRKALNDNAEGYDKIALGHNLDDEAQSILMNLFRNQIPLLFRLGPMSKTQEGMTPRIKPSYFLSEKEVATYAHLMKLSPAWSECPNAIDGYRSDVRNWLNKQEEEHSGSKRNIINWFLKIKEEKILEEKEAKKCAKCGAPSSAELCRACQLQVKPTRV